VALLSHAGDDEQLAILRSDPVLGLVSSPRDEPALRVLELELPHFDELELPHCDELELPHSDELELPHCDEQELPHCYL